MAKKSEPILAQPELLTASAVARRLGVAVDTLRTWDRRYGLGPSDRAAGSRRRYTSEDLSRLQRMRMLVAEGMPAAAAASAVKTDDFSIQSASTGRFGGGRTLAVPGGTAEHHGLARAAAALDVDSVEQLLSESISAHGAMYTWDTLLRPVLTAVGRRWESSGNGVEIEHLLSQTAVDVFRQAARGQKMRTSVPVLAATVEAEAHILPVYALAAALGEVGVPVRVVGASTPAPALQAAAERLGPSGIFLWCQISDAAMSSEELAVLPRARPRRRVVVGGPGWEGTELPEVVSLAATLDEALSLLSPWDA